MKASGAIMSGVRCRAELQALQAANSWKGNQPTKVKPTNGLFTSSRFQNAVYRLIFAGSFPKGAFDIEKPPGSSLEEQPLTICVFNMITSMLN
jgi:hypothetical protein